MTTKSGGTTRGRARKATAKKSTARKGGGTMSGVTSGEVEEAKTKSTVKEPEVAAVQPETTTEEKPEAPPEIKKPEEEITPKKVPAKPKGNVVMVRDLQTRQRISIGRFNFRFVEGRVRPIPIRFLDTFKSMDLVEEVS